MAATKTGTKKSSPKGATKKAAPKKKAAAPKKKAAAPKKKAAPKAAKTKGGATKKAAPKKKAAAVKLTDAHRALLQKVSGASEPGYSDYTAMEDRSLKGLQAKKLLKRGKVKGAKSHHYTVTKAGMKHLGGSSSSMGA